MTDRRTTAPLRLPHHKLVAYDVALQMLAAVKAADIRDPKLRDQAEACLRIADGLVALLTGLCCLGRWSRPEHG
jgi:hypothetical protein